MTETVISEVFKTAVLWDHRNKAVTTGTLLTPISDREQQESQDEETINDGESQMYEVESTFSEDATSEIQDPAPTAC